MKRPVLWILGFLICGIVLGAFGNDLPLYSLGTVSGLFLCVVLYRFYRYLPVYIFILFMIAGIWRVGHSLHSYTTYPVQTELHGVAIDVGVTSGGNQRVIVRMKSGLRVMAYIRPHQPWAELGQEIAVLGELRPLSMPSNPGGYNQFRHLRAQKVDAVIWPDYIHLGKVSLSPMVMLRMVRDRLAAVYDEILPPREAAVIRSMVLGDRADMDMDLAQQYRSMGIFHILSISGLHVAILMMAFSKALGLFLTERRSGIIVLAVMILYCLMTGAGIATVRAVTMGGVLVFGKILSRKYDLITAVSWACVALLLYEPLYLFNVGFQLSFAAVFGIGVLTAPVERLLTKLHFPQWGKFRSGLGVSIAATVATYPVFAFHMYEIQLYSVIGNVIIAPTTTIILVTGLVVGLLGLVWTGGATILAGTVYFILRFYEITSSFFAGLPNAMLLTGGGSLIVTGLGVTVLLAFAYTFNGFGEVFRKRLGLLFFTIVVLSVAVFIRHNPRGLHITVLDTIGNYTVIRHRGNVLVTGSPRGGEDALFRYLDMHGVRRADGLILTELPRARDANRLERLAERFEVFYVSHEAEAAIPYALPIYDGSIYSNGRMTARISTYHGGNINLHIVFGGTAITLENGAVNEFSAAQHGTVRMYSNGRRIRMR
ncbi:MAG: ComEC/Rec2 family competence protein [Firmicutes bacterium]|nr:ComEC/Rec2 family competence protein [Bacillota bacterium]